MRKCIVSALFFLAAAGAGNTGSAILEDASVAIAVVTSQPGHTLRQLTDSMLKWMNVPKAKVFENSATRVFYQDRTGRDASEPSALSAMVPGKGGTCSSRVMYLPTVPDETVRKIALSLGPVE